MEGGLSADSRRYPRWQHVANLLEAMADAVYIVSQQFDVEYANSALEQQFGPGTGRKCFDYLHGRGTPCPWCPNDEVFAGKTVRWEWHSPQTDQFYDLTDTPLHHPDGRISKLEIMRDVTERRRSEAELQTAEERFRTVAEFTYNWEYWTAPDGAVIYTSPAIERITGYTSEEFLQNPKLLLHIVHADDRTTFRQHQRDAQTERAVHSLDLRIVTRDGQVRWIGHVCQPVYGSGGDWLGWRSSNRDITERKQAEREREALLEENLQRRKFLEHLQEELRRERDFVDAVLDTSGGLIVVLDRQGRIVRFNRACERTTGYSFAEVKDQAFSDLFIVPEEKAQVDAVVEKLLAGNLPSENENYWLDRDGGRRWITWSNTVLTGTDGAVEYIIGTGIDTTERHQAEADLQAALAAAIQREQEISALLAATRSVLAQPRFADAARSLIAIAKDLTGATAGSLSLVSSDGQEEEIIVLDGEDLPGRMHPDFFPRTQDLGSPAGNRSKAVYHNHVSSGQGGAQVPAAQVEIENELFAPLMVENQTVGFLGLFNKPGGLDSHDARLLETLGELAALALHRSRLLESLEESEMRFRSVVETASEAIVTADAQGHILFWNRMAQSMFGYQAQEVVGQRLTVLMPTRFHDTHQAGMHRVVTTGRSLYAGETVETVGARRDGTEFPLEMSLAFWRIGETPFFTAVLRDISERKRAEEALHQTNQSLEALIHASPLAIVAMDLERNLRLWNPAAERIFGWSEEEILGRPYPLVPPEKEKESQSLVALTRRGESLAGYETVRRTKEGRLLDVAFWSAPLRDATLKITGTMLVVADITARKHTERALRQYADQQAALYTVAAAVATTLDPDKLLTTVLETVLPLLAADAGWIILPGESRDDPPRIVAWRDTPPEVLDAESTLPLHACPFHESILAPASSVERPDLVMDCPRLSGDPDTGTKLQSHVCVPLSAGDRVLGVLKIGWLERSLHAEQNRDLLVTIGHQVGMALHNAHLFQAARQLDRLQTLSTLDRALAASLELERLAEVLLQRAAASLDAAAGAIVLLPGMGDLSAEKRILSLGLGWQTVTIPAEETFRWHHFLNHIVAQEGPLPFDGPDLVRNNLHPEKVGDWKEGGLTVPIRGEQALLAVLALSGRGSGRPYSEEDRALLQVIASHAGQAMHNAQIYERLRRVLQEHEQTRVQLIQSEKVAALGRLAASVAHEINNPLQGIKTCLTLVQEELDVIGPHDPLNRYLKVVSGELGRISEIVRRMRDFHRPAVERLETTDVLTVLDSVLRLTEKQLQHGRIAVDRVTAGDIPVIQANPDHLKQVFLNLVLNAVDAMPDGGTLTVETGPDLIQRSGDQLEAAVRLRFRDSGAGMTPEMQERLFEPFVTTKEEGAGLGLYICYTLVQAHNGQIAVDSHVGEGTTISILLPVGQG